LERAEPKARSGAHAGVTMLRAFKCTLHVHTCLSPCGDLDMHPRAIVDQALASGLDIIAISDHNSSENVPAVLNAAQGTALTIIPGMEVTTREEVHMLSLFENMEKLSVFQEFIYSRLDGLNDAETFGMQVIANELGEVEGFNDRLLIGATRISIEELVNKVHELGGLSIPAHIDRPAFGMLNQLGFMPPQVPFDALEISARLGIIRGRQKYPELSSYTFVTSSDAHFLQDIAQAFITLYLEEPSFSEIRKALRKEDGRYVEEGPC